MRHSTEPATPTLTSHDSASDIASGLVPSSCARARRNVAPTLTVDGIRIGTSWNEAVLATQTVDDGAGYRLLGAPVQDVTVGTLAGINLVQGVTGQYPTAGDNLFLELRRHGHVGGYVAATDVAQTGHAGPRLLLVPLRPEHHAGRGQPSAAARAGSYTVPERRALRLGPGEHDRRHVGFNSINADGFYLLANPFAQPLASTGITYSGSGTFSTSLQATTRRRASSRSPAPRRPTSRCGRASSPRSSSRRPRRAGRAPNHVHVRSPRAADRGATALSRDDGESGLAFALDGTTDAGTTHDAAAIVRVDAAASAGWDEGDASKLTPPTAVHALVAPVGDLFGMPRRQAVLSLPSPADVTLAFTTTHAGTFTLTADATGLSADATSATLSRAPARASRTASRSRPTRRTGRSASSSRSAARRRPAAAGRLRARARSSRTRRVPRPASRSASTPRRRSRRRSWTRSAGPSRRSSRARSRRASRRTCRRHGAPRAGRLRRPHRGRDVLGDAPARRRALIRLLVTDCGGRGALAPRPPCVRP